MLLSACLVAAALFGLLGLGRPKVAVAIALDLSASTYSSQFNAPGTVMSQEIQAVRSYLQQNDQLLREPNQIQILGFGGVVQPLTSDFKTDSQQLETELDQALQDPNLPLQIVTNTTDLNLAIQKSTSALSNIRDRCRELLIVTDGEAEVSPDIIAGALTSRVKINAVVVGTDAPALRTAAAATNGIYLSGAGQNLETFFTDTFFIRFNSNLKWIIFWLGAAWIALMWLLILPLDRWIYQGLLKLSMSLAGRIALGNALFWTILTPIVVWRLSGLPLISSC